MVNGIYLYGKWYISIYLISYIHIYPTSIHIGPINNKVKVKIEHIPNINIKNLILYINIYI